MESSRKDGETISKGKVRVSQSLSPRSTDNMPPHKARLTHMHDPIYFGERAQLARHYHGVTQSRFRYIYLLASERSERDTYRGNAIENRGCLFICLYICLDVRKSFCTLTLAFLC